MDTGVLADKSSVEPLAFMGVYRAIYCLPHIRTNNKKSVPQSSHQSKTVSMALG